MRKKATGGEYGPANEPSVCLTRVEGAVTETVLRAMEAQERARQLALQATRLRLQFQALSRRQEVFESTI